MQALRSTSIYLFSIEGNIGAGKSTLMHMLDAVGDVKHACDATLNADVKYIQEPVSEWTSDYRGEEDAEPHNILQLFYSDPTKYAFVFQMLACLSRIRTVRREVKMWTGKRNLVLITERSVYADRHVFMKLMETSGLISAVESRVYREMFDEFKGEVPLSGVIHFHVPPETCMDRIRIRDRTEECPIDAEYLVKMDHRLTAFTSYIQSEHLIPATTLDGSPVVSRGLDEPAFVMWSENIRAFIVDVVTASQKTT